MPNIFSKYNNSEIFLAVVLYFSFAQLGFLFSLPDTNIALIWLPAGFAAGCLLLYGWHATIGIFIAAFLSNYYPLAVGSAELTLKMSLLVALNNSIGALFIAKIFSISNMNMSSNLNLRFILKLMFVAILGTFPTALLGTLIILGKFTGISITEIINILTWWSGDSIGVVAGIPLMMIFHNWYKEVINSTRLKERALLFCTSLAFSIILYGFALAQENSNNAIRYETESETIISSFRNDLIQIFQHQEEVADKIGFVIPITRMKFQAAVKLELFGEFSPNGIYSISWNPLVTDQERSNFEMSAAEEGYADYSVRSRDSSGNLQRSPQNEQYLPVLHIEPFAENSTALGFDLFSETFRKNAAIEALQTGKSIITAPVNLVQITDAESSLGALVIKPVRDIFSSDQSPYLGVIVFVINFDTVFSSTSLLSSGAYETLIYDVSDSNSVQLLFHNSPELSSVEYQKHLAEPQSFESISFIEFGNRKLQVFVSPSFALRQAYSSNGPLFVLFAALIISFLAGSLYLQRIRALRNRSRELLRTAQILNEAPDSIVTLDESGLVTGWNDAAEKMFGYSLAEVSGKPIYELIIPENMVSLHKNAMKSYNPDNESKIIGKVNEIQALRKNGEEFPIELAVKRLDQETSYEFIGVIRDLTLKKKQEEIDRQQQKNQLVGQMTGGLAHDFNNMLGIVITNLDYLQSKNLDEHLTSHVRNALDAAFRASEVTRSLLRVARKSRSIAEICDNNALLRDLYSLLQSSIGKQVSLVLNLENHPLWISVDKNNFSNAVINLIVNARDALTEKSEKTVEISTSLEKLLSKYKELMPGEYVVTEIKDNGRGIPAENLEKVFEPYFTTKQIGDGTGLGLPMVYSFARQHGGSVFIESGKEISGTKVKIYLPNVTPGSVNLASQKNDTVSEASSEPTHSTKNSLPPGISRQSVLLVDDEHNLRRVAARLFKDIGFYTLEASTADEAMAVLAAENVDILFTDIAMPGKYNGIDLASWTAINKPSVKIILVTGYLSEQSREQIKPEWQVIEKPYRRNDIVKVLGNFEL